MKTPGKIGGEELAELLSLAGSKSPDLKPQNFAASLRLHEIRNEWKKLAGESLAAHTQIIRFTGKELVILCDHSIYAQQLHLISAEITAALARAGFGRQIRLQVKTGRILWNQEKPAQPTAAEAPHQHPNHEILEGLLERLQDL